MPKRALEKLLLQRYTQQSICDSSSGEDTKIWAGSGVQSCTAPAHLCTSTSLHTHLPTSVSCLHACEKQCPHASLGSSHLPVCAGICLYTHSPVSAHPQTLTHIFIPTPVSLHNHVPMQVQPFTHTRACAHLHTLSISPPGCPAISFMFWLVRNIMSAGCAVPRPVGMCHRGSSPGQAFLTSWCTQLEFDPQPQISEQT